MRGLVVFFFSGFAFVTYDTVTYEHGAAGVAFCCVAAWRLGKGGGCGVNLDGK